MKKERQNAILEIIAKEEIPTQEILRDRMVQQGFNVTQATLSRDIRELKLTKVRRGNGHRTCYTVSVQAEPAGHFWHTAALRTDWAGNVAVIHCQTGTAQAVAASLDALHQENVVGTIAGDDTIFVLLRTEEQAKVFAEDFAEFMETGGI